jgi:hypothetical protein
VIRYVKVDYANLSMKYYFGCVRLSEANEMLSVPVIDNLHDHLDVPSMVDAFACSTVSI